jgi:hypothetical protein
MWLGCELVVAVESGTDVLRVSDGPVAVELDAIGAWLRVEDATVDCELSSPHQGEQSLV